MKAAHPAFLVKAWESTRRPLIPKSQSFTFPSLSNSIFEGFTSACVCVCVCVCGKGVECKTSHQSTTEPLAPWSTNLCESLCAVFSSNEVPSQSAEYNSHVFHNNGSYWCKDFALYCIAMAMRLWQGSVQASTPHYSGHPQDP